MILAVTLLLFAERVPAFEMEIHYRSQAALALASGWPIQDALWIAGSDLAIDMNEATVAGLESNTLQALPHQAEKNFHFHCFSRVQDKAEEQRDRRNADVVQHLDQLKRDAIDAMAQAKRNQADAQRQIEALVAIGVYFHCQQDSWSHSGYGGTSHGHVYANAYPGTPDHPAERPRKTAEALRESMTVLNEFSRLWHGSQSLNDTSLQRLIVGLTDSAMKAFGFSACLANWPGYWLYQDLRLTNRLKPFDVELRPAADGCGVLHNKIFGVPGGAARIVRFPGRPHYPALTLAGRLRTQNGQPVTLDAGPFDYVNVAPSATYAPHPQGCAFRTSVTARNLGPDNGGAAKVTMALMSSPSEQIWFEQKEIGSLPPNQQVTVEMEAVVRRQCANNVAFVSDIQPLKPVGDGFWADRDARNDQRSVAALPGNLVAQR